MKPIRVLQVLTIMNRGGAETMIMNYYRNIDRTKVQFDFMLHRRERGAFDDEIEALGGRIFRMPNIGLRNLSKYREDLDDFFKTHQEYQIIHSHLNSLSVFILKVARKNNIPVRIAHSHTSLYNLNLNPFSKERHSIDFAIKFFAQNLFKRKIPIYATHYFSCGYKAGEWLFGKKNKQKIKIINNAIETENFTFDIKKSQEVKKEFSLNEKTVIGHVGNFQPEKNHSFLIQVFNELKKRNENVILLLVGGGNKTPIEQKVHELELQEDVLFLGVRSDVANILQAVDIFLFPSTNEGLPVTLIEAQASGLKIIASDEISKELDITGLVNFISLSKNPEYWANKLVTTIGYQRENTSHKIIKGNYDIQNNAMLLQEFYYNYLKSI